MMDETDLVGQLKEAAPLRAAAYERARTTLQAVMTEAGSVRVLESEPARGQRFSRGRNRRRTVGTASKVGIGAGIGVAAAAAAIALVATSSSTGSTVPAVAKAPATAPSGPASQAPAAASPLVTLAAYIKASDHSTGDASLVIATSVIGSKTMPALYTAYADSGAIYSGYSLSDIKYALAHHQDLAQDISGRIFPATVKAAILAATGNLAQDRVTMIDTSGNDPLLGLSPAEQKTVWDKEQQQAKANIAKMKGVAYTPKPYSPQAVQEQADNILWTNCFIALSADDGNAGVREGVLRLLSTISGIKVANSTTNGESTLTITAGPEVFGGEGYQVVTIDAKTGMLLKSVTNPGTGVATSVTTYQVSRVTLARI